MLKIVGDLFTLSGDYWRAEWFLCLVAVSAVISWHLKRLHWSVSLAFMTYAVTALWVAESPWTRYKAFSPMDWCSVKYLAASSLLAVIGFAWVATKRVNHLPLWIASVAMVDAILTIAQYAVFGVNSKAIGFIGICSLNGAALALAFPAIVTAFPLWSLVPVLFAIFISTSHTAFLVLIAMALAVAVSLKYWKAVTCSVFLGLMGACVFHAHSISDRFGMSAATIDYAAKSDGLLGGMGAGSFWLYGLHIQKSISFNLHERWFWLHNDWVQMLFENGALVLASVALMFGFALWKSRRTPWLFASLVGYFVCGIFYFPLHFAPTALLGALLIGRAFNHES